MKTGKVLLSLLIVAAVLFASVFSAVAIGFEAEKIYESVFVIYSGTSLGSGFAVGENCIVTNAHVIEDPRDITVSTYGGDRYRAYVCGIDTQADIAVLAVENVSFPYLQIADLSEMKTGDDIYAIGAPEGMAYTLTKGGISAKERIIRQQTYIQIDAPINHGNSGGPLLNDNGQVLGMNTLKMSNAEGIGLAIPIVRICDYLQELGIELSASGNVERPLQIPAQTQPAETEPDVQDENKTPSDAYVPKQRTPAITYVVAVIAVVSIGGNVALAVLLIKEKKKSSIVPYDPSERTDFDIEILE